MAENPDPLTGADLRTWRQSLRLSAEQVSRAAGVSRRRIRQWEDGTPTPRAAARYLAAVTQARAER